VPNALFAILITPVVELITSPAGVALNVPPNVNPVAKAGEGLEVVEHTGEVKLNVVTGFVYGTALIVKLVGDE
jgi:hypothetical protein